MAPHTAHTAHTALAPQADITAHIFGLTSLRLLVCAAAVFFFAPNVLGGAGREPDIAPALAIVASPVVYAAVFSFLLFCRPRRAAGAALLLLLGVVEGAAFGAALALLGWGWLVMMTLIALVGCAGVFGALALAAFEAPKFGSWAVAAGLLWVLLVNIGCVFLMEANVVEMFCAWVTVIGATLFSLRDMPGVLARVGEDEAGLGAAVFGMSVILDSVAREGSPV